CSLHSCLVRTSPPEIYTLSLHDALPIWPHSGPTVVGTNRSTPAPVSPATSTSATTCTGSSSRSPRWAGTSEEVAMSGRADDVLVVCPLTVEAVSVWWGLRGGDVVRAGMRARRRSAVLAALRQRPEVPVVVAGVACALTSATRPGDLVVPDVVCSPRGTWECATAPLLASVLRGNGHTVHRGALVESDRVVWRVRRGTA